MSIRTLNAIGNYILAIGITLAFFTGMVLFWKYAIAPSGGGQDQFATTTIKYIEIEKEVILRAPTCSGGHEGYKALREAGGGTKHLVLTDNAKSYGKTRSGGFLVAPRDANIERVGILACGYLYVKGSVNSKPIDVIYDSFYINPHNRGGHLVLGESLEVPKLENFTQILFPLNSIQYQSLNEKSTGVKHIADWVYLLNSGKVTNFKMGLSTLNQTGLIEEITIVYKCWNPDTGKETDTCSLSLIK